MFSVIFEVLPGRDRKDEYLELAKHLRPILETMDGFIDNERFESRLRSGWILSHSTWRDEKSVVRWRTQGEHHAVQKRGRFELFDDYHLRVGELTFDSDPPRQAPMLEQRFDETEIGIAKVTTLTELTPRKGAAFAGEADLVPGCLGLDSDDDAVVEHDIFESIYIPGKLALRSGGRMRKPQMPGHRGSTASRNCATAEFASCATMAASTAAKRLSSTPISRKPGTARADDIRLVEAEPVRSAGCRGKRACRHAHACGRARHSGAASGTPSPD